MTDEPKADTDQPKTDFKTRGEVRKHLNSIYDYDFKMTGYLLAAHAAGMIACLSVLKDYKDNPQLQGIGIFIILFGTGLILSALSFTLLAAGIEAHYAYAALERDEEKEQGNLLFRGYTYAMNTAAIVFITAVAIGMYRFGKL